MEIWLRLVEFPRGTPGASGERMRRATVYTLTVLGILGLTAGGCTVGGADDTTDECEEGLPRICNPNAGTVGLSDIPLLRLDAGTKGDSAVEPDSAVAVDAGVDAQADADAAAQGPALGNGQNGTVPIVGGRSVLRYEQSCRPTPKGNRWSTCVAIMDNTPIVLSFGGDDVALSHEIGGAFDLSGNGTSVATHWPTSATPWLVRDLDGNGRIDDGTELFGSMTRLSTGVRARHGFEALAELDEDGDGWLTAKDPAFASLRVWSDRDQDRQSSPSELASLEATGVIAIEVQHRVERRCDDAGNCGIERSRIRFVRNGQPQLGAAIDVHLPGR